MSMTITLGWWIIPALVTIAALWWMFSQDYRGYYNFSIVFTAPMTGLAICFAWMVYAMIGWWLA